MKVVNAVAHKLNKKAKVAGATANFARSPLVDSQELADLVSQLLTTFNNKTSQRTGVFEQEAAQYPFGPGLRKYLDKKLTFVAFTKAALKQLAFLIQNVHSAEGGYIFFVHYQVNGSDFFTVAKLNDASGKVFNKSRTRVVNNSYLSLDKLHHVGRVNIGAWESDASKYLSFVNARENGESSDYFVTFLGCSTATKPKVETAKLVSVVEAFCKSENMTEEEVGSFKQAVYDHAKALPKGVPVSLAVLANAVWPAAPEAFIKYINESEVAPSDDFCIDPSSLKPLIGYKVNIPGLRMWMTSEFKRSHQVRFNDRDELIISGAGAMREELE